MARGRWFYSEAHQRRGPVPFDQLVESVLRQSDPGSVLVWRRGFPDWTRADDVPQVERRIAPLLAGRDAVHTERLAPAPSPPPAPAPVEKPGPGRSAALVWGGAAAGVATLGLLGWLFWPRQPAPTPVVTLPLEETVPESPPPVAASPPVPAATVAPEPPPLATLPTPAPSLTPTPRPAGPAVVPETMADRETDLPPAELGRLRGVAAWSGDTLRLTVYNGTTWRVTELHVRIGRFSGDELVEDAQPIVMLRPGGPVDAGVADLLNRVAPDRKKPGLNPADTGAFEAKAGPQPESYRWDIERARGYAPR